MAGISTNDEMSGRAARFSHAIGQCSTDEQIFTDLVPLNTGKKGGDAESKKETTALVTTTGAQFAPDDTHVAIQSFCGLFNNLESGNPIVRELSSHVGKVADTLVGMLNDERDARKRKRKDEK